MATMPSANAGGAVTAAGVSIYICVTFAGYTNTFNRQTKTTFKNDRLTANKCICTSVCTTYECVSAGTASYVLDTRLGIFLCLLLRLYVIISGNSPSPHKL